MAERKESLAERLDVKYWAFRVMAAITPLVPLWLARRLAVAVGALAWLVAGGLRERAERNLRHIPSLGADPAQLRQATRGVFITLALNYLDFFRGRFVTYEELSRGWDIRDWDQFERAMRSGRGVIVLGAHLGPFEYAAWKMGELGYSMLTPAERLRPERFNQLVGQLRNHHRARLLPGDDRETLRELLATLHAGDSVMFAVDRWVMGPADAWPFFGEPARLPTAPFALAARSEAPVVMMLPWRVGFDRVEAAVVVVTPERMPPEDGAGAAGAVGAAGAAEQSPVSPERLRGADREAAIARMRQRTYATLERYISAHPDQWVSALSIVWDAPTVHERQPKTADNVKSSIESKEESGQARVSAPREPARTAMDDVGGRREGQSVGEARR
ncbi:MAG TPA: hypothetical protein VF812_02315 [Ktedonobacterales bacterium]